jgi:uncharacterized membrane protein
MTGVVALLVTAAWQKPNFYEKHLSDKIFFLLLFLCFLSFSWDLALGFAAESIPVEFNDIQKQKLIDSFKKISVPQSWFYFIVFIIIVNFVLGWLARTLIKSDKT